MPETLGSVRSQIARVIDGGVCSTDSRVALYLNEAQRRLLAKGKWKNAICRYFFKATNKCITLPREIETILGAQLCGVAIPIRNGWYEFSESGPGVQTAGLSADDQVSTLHAIIDRGESPVWFDVCGTDKRIRVYADVPESASAQILVKGYDENNNWIRTQVGGVWVDGEYIDIDSIAPHDSTKLFSAVSEIIKPATNGFVRLYEYDTTLLTQRQVAVYWPDELRPAFRRYFIGCIPTDQETCVKVIAKRRFIPAVNENDELLISNVSALKLMCIAIWHEECNEFDKAMAFEQKATMLLNEELSEHIGDASTGNVTIDMSGWSGHIAVMV